MRLVRKSGLYRFYGDIQEKKREKFENIKTEFSEEVREIYDEAKTYRDGK